MSIALPNAAPLAVIRLNIVSPNIAPPKPEPRRGKSGQSGFAYLMALFLVLAVVIGSQVVLQNLLTQGRREREKEMVWRGNQYARAIRLYYKKTGHYPQNIDELKTGVLDLHFLRYAAYKDPMNRDDGSWRFIYVNPTGQIIGSVKYATLQQMAVLEMNGGQYPPPQLGAVNGTAAAAAGNGGAPAAAQGGASGQTPSSPNAVGGSAQNSTSAPAGASTSPGSDQSATSSSGQPVNPLSLLKPTGPVDSPVIGGFLSGVGGGDKSDRPSVRVYNGAKKYKDWEFIWNPLEDQARATQQGIGAATGAGSIAGGIGALFGNPGQGNTTPNPTQNPGPGTPGQANPTPQPPGTGTTGP